MEHHYQADNVDQPKPAADREPVNGCDSTHFAMHTRRVDEIRRSMKDSYDPRIIGEE